MAAVDLTTFYYLNDLADPTSFTVVVTSTDQDAQALMNGTYQIQCHLGPTNVVTRYFPTYQDAADYFVTTYSGIFVASVDSFRGTSGSTFGAVYNDLFRSELDALALKSDISGLASGSYGVAYSCLTGAPAIPTKTSDITNDSGFLTSAPVSSVNTNTGAVVLATTDLADFGTATDGRITTKINALLNGADAAHDTFKELQDLMNADESTAAALAITVGNKVDKVSGKGLSTEDYTTTEKTKLSGIATGATANSSDATLLNRTNHTGSQLSSTISDFTEAAQDAVGNAMSGSNGITVNYNDAGNAIVISGVTPTTNNNVSRTLNSNYTIASNVRGVLCSYSINASWSLNALLSGSGAAFLEYSTDAVTPTTWITVNNTGKGLNLLTVAGNDDMNLSGFIPAGATFTRIRSNVTNMTITYTRGQEVLL